MPWERRNAMAPTDDHSATPLQAANRDSAPEPSPAGRLTPAPPPGAAPARATHLNPRYGPEEFVPGLECDYGSLAYAYADSPLDAQSAQGRSRRCGCHNPTEAPGERHHCDACDRDYCDLHADPIAHDCADVILPA